MQRCTATSRRSGQPCQNWAMHGQQVCRMHGGATPVALKAAQRRLEEQAAAQAVATYGLPVDVDPTTALLAEVHRSAGHVAWLQALIHDLETADLKQYSSASVGPKGDVTLVYERPSVWLRLYQDERAHLARVCKAALDANVDERRVRLAEQQGALIAQVLRNSLTDLGHDPADPQVGQVVARHLRLVQGGIAS